MVSEPLHVWFIEILQIYVFRLICIYHRWMIVALFLQSMTLCGCLLKHSLFSFKSMQFLWPCSLILDIYISHIWYCWFNQFIQAMYLRPVAFIMSWMALVLSFNFASIQIHIFLFFLDSMNSFFFSLAYSCFIIMCHAYCIRILVVHMMHVYLSLIETYFCFTVSIGISFILFL